QHVSQLHKSLRGLSREGFRYIHVLRSQEEVDAAVVERVPLWTNKKTERGPFDIVGDIHGCREELERLLGELGYAIQLGTAPDGGRSFRVTPPAGRKAVFLGDLVDRGPDTPGVLRLVMDMVESGAALCVAGNHDVKLSRKLQGRDVRVSHGLAESL